jgi:D-tyrosyl-tRNA(Tyr) deacylase
MKQCNNSRSLAAVSQFTLLASTKKGNKPDFHRSAGPQKAVELYSAFFAKVQELYDAQKVKDGIFQAMMDVALVNDGPVGVDYNSEDSAVLPLSCGLRSR